MAQPSILTFLQSAETSLQDIESNTDSILAAVQGGLAQQSTLESVLNKVNTGIIPPFNAGGNGVSSATACYMSTLENGSSEPTDAMLKTIVDIQGKGALYAALTMPYIPAKHAIKITIDGEVVFNRGVIIPGTTAQLSFGIVCSDLIMNSGSNGYSYITFLQGLLDTTDKASTAISAPVLASYTNNRFGVFKKNANYVHNNGYYSNLFMLASPLLFNSSLKIQAAHNASGYSAQNNQLANCCVIYDIFD